MATHDYVLANQSGSSFRADLNNALAAIVSQNSNATEPATTFAYQYWVDTSATPALIKQRNAANDAWITLAEVDGQTLAANGTASKPGISFAADVNTGIKRNAADEIGIVTGGAEAVTINSSQRVGIGTTSPGSLLHVSNGNDAASGEFIGLTIGGTNVNNARTASLIKNTTTYDLTYKNNNFSSALGSHIFKNGNSEHVRIDSSGKMGIGSTSPDEPLDVRGGAYNANQDFGIQLGVTTGQWKSGFKIKSDSGGIPRIAIQVPANATGGTTEVLSLLGGTSVGKVGIGTVNPSYPLDVSGNMRVGSSTGYAFIQYGSDSTSTDNWHVGSEGDGTFRFYNGVIGAGSEKMRITSSGVVLVGKTSSNFANSGVEVSPVGNITLTRAGELLTTRRVSTEGTHLSFRSTTGTTVGSVVTTSSSTAYNTSSDYRLKENVVDLDGAIDRVKQLAPKRFNFIADADTTVDGFLAHEAQTVVPEAVTGTHNEVDDDGNAVMQGIDQSKLVPLLTAALKEAIAKIETLETKVAVLEAAN